MSRSRRNWGELKEKMKGENTAVGEVKERERKGREGARKERSILESFNCICQCYVIFFSLMRRNLKLKKKRIKKKGEKSREGEIYLAKPFLDGTTPNPTPSPATLSL
jgi:hypothetical protein